MSHNTSGQYGLLYVGDKRRDDCYDWVRRNFCITYLMKQFDEIACDTEESYLILDEAMIYIHFNIT